MTAPDGSPIYSYNSNYTVPSTSYFDIDASVNYQHLMRNPGEMINIGYQVSTNKNHNNTDTEYTDLVNMPVDYSGIKMKSNTPFSSTGPSPSQKFIALSSVQKPLYVVITRCRTMII